MKRKNGKYYKEIAFRLFDELSGLYAEDVAKHADLCKRYSKISQKYVKWLEKSVKDVKMPNELNMEDSKEKIWQQLQERIHSENEKKQKLNNSLSSKNAI